MRAFGNPLGNPIRDGAGGGITRRIGDIGVFDQDPGIDYVEPKGQTLRLSDYPEIGSVLPTSSGLAEDAVLLDFYNSSYPSLVAGGRYVLASWGNNGSASDAKLIVSRDGGDTLSLITPQQQPQEGRVVSVAMSDDGRYQQVITDAVLINQQAASIYSGDYGTTWTRAPAGSRGAAARGSFWLGAPYNVFASGIDPNADGGGWTTFNPNTLALTAPAWNMQGGCWINGIDCNPNTGIIVVALRPSDGQPRGAERISGIGNGSQAYTGVQTARYIYDVKFKNNIWMIATDGGVLYSTDDAATWKLVPGTSGGYVGINYVAGKWIALGGDNTGRAITIIAADGSSSQLVANFMTANSGTAYYGGSRVGRLFETDRQLIMLGSKGNIPRPFKSGGNDVGSKFVVAPSLSSAGLVSPKKYYMRAR